MDKGILFTNGSVFVGGDFAPRGTSVLIKGNRIAAVGAAVGAADESRGAEVVDLDGGTLLPGFIDSHAHPVFGGMQLLGCDLTAADDAARVPGDHRPVRASEPGPWRGSPAAAGRCPPSPAASRPGRRWTPWWPTDRCSCRTGTAMAPG